MSFLDRLMGGSKQPKQRAPDVADAIQQINEACIPCAVCLRDTHHSIFTHPLHFQRRAPPPPLSP